MSDFFSTAAAMQAEIIRAQRAQLDAAQAMLDAGKQAVDMQEAVQEAADANRRAWVAWANLWGWM